MVATARILIVEDNPGTMNLLEQVVLRAGYAPVLARGGQEALDLLQDEGADLVLLDIMMRDVDGWTVLRSLKTDERLCRVPVIIVSAVAPSEHELLVAAHDGMYEDYFLKPFEIGELVSRIGEVLADSGCQAD